MVFYQFICDLTYCDMTKQDDTQYSGYSSGKTVVRSNTTLRGMFRPVVVVAQPNFGLRPLADGPVLHHPLPLDLHVGLGLLVGHDELAVAAPRLPLCVEPDSKYLSDIRTGLIASPNVVLPINLQAGEPGSHSDVLAVVELQQSGVLGDELD